MANSRLWPILAWFVVTLLLAGVMSARGGDGGDYSGDGSSSGSSGGGSDWGGSSSSSSSDWPSSSSSDSDYGGSSDGGDGGDGVFVIIGAMTILGLAYGVVLYGKYVERRRRTAVQQQQLEVRRPVSLEGLKRQDPNFSQVLFHAFAHMVYVKYHESRGGIARRSADEFAVAPYLSDKLRKRVRNSKEVITQVIVGEFHVAALNLGEKYHQIRVNFKSNIVYRRRNDRLERMLVQEQLLFSRASDAKTRAPEQVLALGCPSCGSKQEPEISGRCPSCGNVSGDGRMDWQVTSISELAPPKPVRGSVAGSSGVEPGTDLPTVKDSHFNQAEQALKHRDPKFNWTDFTERTRVIFMSLQAGWTERDEAILRPYELDQVYDTHRISLERYREEGVRNVLKDIRIEYIKPVEIQHDAWFDSITVRIRASMLDYKVNDEGVHLSGATGTRKVFTEYHTLVRRTNARHSKSANPTKCPQCGAPLDRISQSGICGYCDSRITTGEFDWVLASIIQDEEYAG